MSKINTDNEFLLGLTRRGLHTEAGKPCIRPSDLVPYFTTKQGAYRFAAWLVSMAEMLPDEPGAATFEDVLKAVQSA